MQCTVLLEFWAYETCMLGSEANQHSHHTALQISSKLHTVFSLIFQHFFRKLFVHTHNIKINTKTAVKKKKSKLDSSLRAELIDCSTGLPTVPRPYVTWLGWHSINHWRQSWAAAIYSWWYLIWKVSVWFFGILNIIE